MLHKTLELLVKLRTMSVNALRSHLGENGLVVAKGIGRNDELSELAENTRVFRIPGVGPLTASAIAASVPDPGVFKWGRDFAAWLRLTPRQNSSGGKAKLGAVTKQGNPIYPQVVRRGLDGHAADSTSWAVSC
jgi:transposase